MYGRMAAVAADLSKAGIEKSQYNKNGQYYFRGIDDIYSTVSPILARHRLLILPRIVDRTAEVYASKSGTRMVHTTVIVDYDICAEDGSVHTVRGAGEAADSGDKSLNKALVAAYKYMVLIGFCVPLVGAYDDADYGSPGEDAPAAPALDIEALKKKIAACKDRDSKLALFRQAQKDCGGDVSLWNGTVKPLFSEGQS